MRTTQEHSNNYDKSNWLVLSSFSFTISALYAYYFQLYAYTILLLFTTIVSINYWMNPSIYWRRTAGLMVSKTSFMIFAINGILYINNIYLLIIGYPLLYALLFCYCYSGLLYKQNNPNWYKYHMAFHFLIMVEHIIVLHSVKDYY